MIAKTSPRPRRGGVRRFLLVAAAATVAAPALLEGQTSGTWAVDVGTGGGNWSDPANWVNGIVASNGGTATFPTLATFTTAPVNIVQDLPTVSLSGIDFESQITYLIRPTVPGASTLTLTGPAVLNTPIPSINTISSTFFGHQLQIPIDGSAGLTKNGPGTTTLWQANTFTGGARVNGGILVARQFGDAVFGAAGGSVSLNDGTIRVTTAGWNSSRQIDLAGHGTFESGTTQGITFNGPVTGSGDLNKIGSNGLTLTASNSYTGATNLLGGTMTLSGSGALDNTSAVALRNTLTLDNGGTNVSDRVHNAAPVTFYGSGIALTGSATGPSSERLGNVTLSRGLTTFTVTPGAAQDASISAPQIAREMGGAAFFRGTNLGGGGAGGSVVTFDAAPALIGGGGGPGTTNISIIPWAYGNTNAAAVLNAASNSFVTYGAGGVRPLDVNTEYATSIAPGVSSDNVRITTDQTVNAPATINSLVVGVSSLNVTGVGPLTITSGGVLNLTNGTSITLPLEFGTAEAMIISPGSLSLLGVINGSGGLTKQGAGVTTFGSANTYTGTTTIGGGTASFNSNVPASGPGPFGASAGAVVLAPAGLGTGGTTARLVMGGTGSASFNRPLLVSGRIAVNNAATIPGFGVSGAGGTLVMNGDVTLDDSPLTFVGTAGSTLLINGDITGDGGPITDQASVATSTIRLAGNNTFTGGAEMANATWEVGSDNAFGTGMLKMVQVGGSAIPTIAAVGAPRVISNETVSFSFNANYWQIAGDQPITFTGSINLSGSFAHQINNSALTTYAGVLHTGGFTKGGTGTLVLSGDNVYTGNTTISSGALRITHGGALGSSAAPTIVASGAALEITGSTLSNEPVTINGLGISTTGAIRSLGGNNSLGNVTLAGTSIVAVDAGNLGVSNVSSSVSTAGLFKDGPGTLSARRYRLTAVDVRAGTAAVTPGRSADKTSVLNTLVLLGGTRFDLGDNDLVLDYETSSPLALVRGHIANAYANGAWTGAGLTSSMADASNFALGYGESSAVFTSFPATFSGISVDDTAVLVRWTRYGDADLNGVVNLNDFNALAANFGATSGATWTSGDFDYNGNVNLNDFNKLAANFGLSASGPEVTPDDWAALGAAVPEPTALGLFGVAASAAALRRRRRPDRA